MTDKIKVILLKPLNGRAIGSEAEYDKADFDSLVAMGAVKALEVPANKAAPSPANKVTPKAKSGK